MDGDIDQDHDEQAAFTAVKAHHFIAQVFVNQVVCAYMVGFLNDLNNFIATFLHLGECLEFPDVGCVCLIVQDFIETFNNFSLVKASRLSREMISNITSFSWHVV